MPHCARRSSPTKDATDLTDEHQTSSRFVLIFGCFLRFNQIRKLCSPQHVSMTISRNSEQLKRMMSRIIRYRLISPITCSIRTRTDEIRRFSSFSCGVSVPLRGFFFGCIIDFIKICFDFRTAFCVSAKFGSYAARNMFP